MISPELIKLIEEYSPMPIPEGDEAAETDLYDHLGIYGDDAEELLKKYRARFGVSLAGFDFGSHFPNEGSEAVPALPWMEPRRYLPLTIGDLQRGIERKYLGADPATVASMHAPLSPEEEQGVEDAVFRLKNRLIYKPFFIITVLAAVGSALFCWLTVKIGIEMYDSWFAPLTLAHPLLMWIFVTPRVSLLDKSQWMEDDHYRRLQGGAWAILSFALPVMAPSALLFNYFDGSRNSLLTWAIIVFLVGLFAFLAFIHTYKVIQNSLIEGKRITIQNFGTFYSKEFGERNAWNPKDGVPTKVPAKRVVKFKSSLNKKA